MARITTVQVGDVSYDRVSAYPKKLTKRSRRQRRKALRKFHREALGRHDWCSLKAKFGNLYLPRNMVKGSPGWRIRR